MEQLLNDFSPGLFIMQTVILVILVVLLRKFAWKPILSAVEERENSIQGALDAAKEAEEKMQALTSENEKLLAEAREERDQILAQAKAAKDEIVGSAKSEASEEAAKILADAREQINNEKQKVITELKNQVAGISIEIAERILKSELSDKAKQETLVNNIVEEVNLN
jgi:F-type H+-transporting ATPase subunit b